MSAEQSERVSIRRFYLKRVLRIWPLYFLLVLLAILVFNQVSVVAQGERQKYQPSLECHTQTRVRFPLSSVPISVYRTPNL